MAEETINIVKYPDSLELDFGGTRRGGKVYFNASDKVEAKERVDNMIEIGKYAGEKMGYGGDK